MSDYKQTALPLREHEGFMVMRGDLIPGGVKAVCLTSILASVAEREVVYAAHAHGHSGLALGLAGLENDKKVTLFFAGPRVSTYLFDQTEALSNVQCIVLDNLSHQSQMVEIAHEYAKKSNAYFLPVGFDFPAFNNCLIKLARSLPINPKEVLVPGGSGTTSRCLVKAWPKAKVCTVDLGMMLGADMGTKHVYYAPEAPTEKAQFTPPYPSAIYYDAKMWRFVKNYASLGALIWNVA